MSFELEYDEVCSVYQTDWHVARREHRCACCGIRIPPGAQYERHFMVQDGSARSEPCCFGCACGLWTLKDIHRTHPSPGWAIEFLREEIHGNCRGQKAEVARERDVLAGMLRRAKMILESQ